MVGIGPAKAQAIVEYRDTHGPFKTVDDLLQIKGIGSATLDKNRERVTAASSK
jgi:competence protein ComEA